MKKLCFTLLCFTIEPRLHRHEIERPNDIIIPLSNIAATANVYLSYYYLENKAILAWNESAGCVFDILQQKQSSIFSSYKAKILLISSEWNFLSICLVEAIHYENMFTLSRHVLQLRRFGNKIQKDNMKTIP